MTKAQKYANLDVTEILSIIAKELGEHVSVQQIVQWLNSEFVPRI
jgi:hypothetical protein